MTKLKSLFYEGREMQIYLNKKQSVRAIEYCHLLNSCKKVLHNKCFYLLLFFPL